MERVYMITSNNLDDKYVVEKSITLKLTDEKFEEIRELAIETDDTIEEILTCIVENNLLDKMDHKDFKQLVIDAYYKEMFTF